MDLVPLLIKIVIITYIHGQMSNFVCRAALHFIFDFSNSLCRVLVTTIPNSLNSYQLKCHPIHLHHIIWIIWECESKVWLIVEQCSVFLGNFRFNFILIFPGLITYIRRENFGISGFEAALLVDIRCHYSH